MTKKKLNKKEEKTTIPKLSLTEINESYAAPYPSPGSDDDMEKEVFKKEDALKQLEKLVRRNNKNELKEFLFDSKNKYILHDAVEENKQKLVDKILELVPHWIDRLSPTGYTILHTALGGKAKLVMIKTLLEAMPKLIHESNKEGLTPIKFGEKHSFGGAKSEEEIIEMRKLLEDYEKKNIEVEAFTREEMEELGYYLYEHIDITTLG